MIDREDNGADERFGLFRIEHDFPHIPYIDAGHDMGIDDGLEQALHAPEIV